MRRRCAPNVGAPGALRSGGPHAWPSSLRWLRCPFTACEGSAWRADAGRGGGREGGLPGPTRVFCRLGPSGPRLAALDRRGIPSVSRFTPGCRTQVRAGAFTGPSETSHSWAPARRAALATESSRDRHSLRASGLGPSTAWRADRCQGRLPPGDRRSAARGSCRGRAGVETAGQNSTPGRGRPPSALPSHSGAPAGSLWVFWWGRSLPGGAVPPWTDRASLLRGRAATAPWCPQARPVAAALQAAERGPQGGGACSLASPRRDGPRRSCDGSTRVALGTWALSERWQGPWGATGAPCGRREGGCELPPISRRPRLSQVPACVA